MVDRFSLLAQCPLGLESEAAAEMRELGLAVEGFSADHGIVEWTGDLGDVDRAHRWLRCVDRITVLAGEFRARAFGELKRKVAEVDWSDWIGPEQGLILRVTSRGSRLYHERAVAERVHEAIETALGRPVQSLPAASLDQDPRAQLVVVRIERDACTLRVDASGTRLHRRGYRQATAKAPLRETLAASILRAAGWSPGMPLQDPFCGSGTFVIEGAQRALGIPAGGERTFAFERWPIAADLPESNPPASEAAATAIAGSDRAEGALRAARSNAERAGVTGAIEFAQRTVSECVPVAQRPGHLVTNPPYGSRTGGEDLLPLHAAFGRVLHERFPGWRLSMLCADPSHAAAMELPWTLGPWINNGGLRVRLLHADVPQDGS